MAHFYEDLPSEVRNLSDMQAVDAYAAAATLPGKAIVGLTPQQLNSLPIPGTWSIQQIVLHLFDTDLVASYRMKRMIAEDRPKLDMYDETAFAQQLHYDKLSALDAAEMFRLNRIQTAQLLRVIPATAFARTALHPELGELSLAKLLRAYVHHPRHHWTFVEKKRRLLGAASVS